MTSVPSTVPSKPPALIASSRQIISSDATMNSARNSHGALAPWASIQWMTGFNTRRSLAKKLFHATLTCAPVSAGILHFRTFRNGGRQFSFILKSEYKISQHHRHHCGQAPPKHWPVRAGRRGAGVEPPAAAEVADEVA